MNKFERFTNWSITWERATQILGWIALILFSIIFGVKVP